MVSDWGWMDGWMDGWGRDDGRAMIDIPFSVQ